MFSRFAALAMTSVMASATVINEHNGDIPLHSSAGRKLVQKARRVENNQNYANGQYGGNYQQENEVDWNDIDTSFIAGYSVKFQGCHHVQQWNDDAEDADDIKIMTQRLVRFRMCPSDVCSSTFSVGCDSNYGDYLVDMGTYVEAYIEQAQQQYAYNNGGRKLEEGFNLGDYLECTQMDLNANQRRRARELRELNDYYGGNNYYNNNNNNEDVAYYVGPYCAEQGGEIRLGVFYDDTCTVTAEEGVQMFQYANNGMTLPYSDQSMVSMGCLSCGGYGEVNDMCNTLYEASGKCETKMNVYYPNESSCSYIDGIKVIRDDGVIRTSATRKSTAAAITTGVFLTAALLLAGYVYYLRTKLGRARINLAASSQNAGL